MKASESGSFSVPKTWWVSSPRVMGIDTGGNLAIKSGKVIF
jgi:hypothetical protein